MASKRCGDRAIHRGVIGLGAAFDGERQAQVRLHVGNGRELRKPLVSQARSLREVGRPTVQSQTRGVDRGKFVALVIKHALPLGMLDGVIDQAVGVGLLSSRASASCKVEDPGTRSSSSASRRSDHSLSRVVIAA